MISDQPTDYTGRDLQATEQLHNLKTQVAGMAWPRIVTGAAAQALAMQFKLQRTQYYPQVDLERLQLQQLARLLSHAQRRVPFYGHRIPHQLLRGRLTLERFRELPMLRRSEVIQAGDQLLSAPLLKRHDQLSKVQTSGSTGMPVTAYGTQLTRFFWDALTLREHLWLQRDFNGKLLAIRPGSEPAPGEIMRADGWGESVNQLFVSGPGALINSGTDIANQARLVEQEDPEYLLSIASNLYELLVELDRRGADLKRLKQIRCYGEVCKDELRTLARERFGVLVVDAYSTQELGYLALQCPEGRMHIQSEAVLVEVLNAQGEPCAAGEVGEVAVTTLLNFAFPLIRYALGDYAEVGESCPCGRQLPVLARIVGRERNMLHRPDGTVHWPSFPASAWAGIGSIRQLQLTQEKLETIRALLVAERPFTESEQAAFVRLLQDRFGYPFDIQIEYVAQIPRGPGGKYEDFKSLL